MVGLDIETGSVAATEVRVNGTTEVVGGGVLPLGSGVFREGEVADPEALGQAIKELFARESSRATCASGSRTSESRSGPCAFPPSTIATSSRRRFAFRPRTTSRCRSISPSSTGRWSGTLDRRERRPQGRRRRGRGAPRHDRPDAGRDLGCRPPADRDRPFGLRHDPRARPRGRRAGRPGRVRLGPVVRGSASRPTQGVQGAAAGREPRSRQALLQPRRRHEPGRRSRQLLPLHPHRVVRSRGHRPEACRAPAAHRRALQAVAHPCRARAARRGDRGRP